MESKQDQCLATGSSTIAKTQWSEETQACEEKKVKMKEKVV